MYKNYFDLQIKPKREQIHNLPEFLKIECVNGIFSYGNDYLVIDRKIFEDNRPVEHPRYFKLELIEDHVFPYPVEAKVISENVLQIKFENGEVKNTKIYDYFLKEINLEKVKDNESVDIVVKEHRIYINDVLFGDVDIYTYCL